MSLSLFPEPNNPCKKYIFTKQKPHTQVVLFPINNPGLSKWTTQVCYTGIVFSTNLCKKVKIATKNIILQFFVVFVIFITRSFKEFIMTSSITFILITLEAQKKTFHISPLLHSILNCITY